MIKSVVLSTLLQLGPLMTLSTLVSTLESFGLSKKPEIEGTFFKKSACFASLVFLALRFEAPLFGLQSIGLLLMTVAKKKQDKQKTKSPLAL
ncbi:MAG: hypothetical protein GY820_16090 [Gammaproteobacteria bacterium]|nr:hypothetical protein [Gammaproteobacteria bacterium]